MISSNLTIRDCRARVYESFRNLEFWRSTLADVVGVESLYDDGLQQEFRMTVSRPRGNETIRGIRFCDPGRRISLFQPEPPPGFRRMTGEWTFEDVEGGVQVTAKRWFELDDAIPEDHARVGTTLQGYLERNLRTFRQCLESNRG